MAGAPSHLELFDNKPQLAKFDGTLPPAELLKGYRAAFINPELEAARARSSSSPGTASAGPSCPSCCPTWPKVVDDIAIVKSHGDRRLQPRARPDPDEHRLAAVRPAEHRRLGLLRPGQRVAGPARLRRLQHRQEGPQRRQLELGQRLPADGLPGRAVPHRRRPGALPLEPAGRRRRSCSATRSTPSGSSTRCGSSAIGDPEIATRINSFEMAFRMQTTRARGDGHQPRAAAHPRPVRRRAGQAVVRQHLPAGPPAGRARRAVRAALPRGLGPARQPGRATSSRTARTPTRPAPPSSRT